MKLNASRTAQWPLVSEFTFNFDDTIAATDGVVKPFSAGVTATLANLPEGAVVINGELVVETAYAGATTATLSLGDSVSATRYANAVDLKTAGRTALTLTGHRAVENLRGTLTTTGAAATAGKVTVRVMFTLPGRANENIPS